MWIPSPEIEKICFRPPETKSFKLFSNFKIKTSLSKFERMDRKRWAFRYAWLEGELEIVKNSSMYIIFSLLLPCLFPDEPYIL